MPISHTIISNHHYLFLITKGEKMKKIGIILAVLALLGGTANAGTTSCYSSCYGNSCYVTCYDY